MRGLSIVVCALMAASVSATAAPPRSLPVEVRICAPELAAVRVAVEASAPAELAPLFQARFPFFQWTGPEAGEEPRLVLLLQPIVPEEQRQPDAISAGGQVEWREIRSGGEPAVAWCVPDAIPGAQLQLNPVRLYGPRERPPAFNPDKLQRALVTLMEGWLQNESNRADLHRFFLKDVPLANNVSVESDMQLIHLPLGCDTLLADFNSVLRVAFRAKHYDDPARVFPGVLKLSPLPGAGNDPSVMCSVVQFQYPPTPLFDHWHEKLPAALEETRRVSLDVFMETYVRGRCSATSGGAANTP